MIVINKPVQTVLGDLSSRKSLSLNTLPASIMEFPITGCVRIMCTVLCKRTISLDAVIFRIFCLQLTREWLLGLVSRRILALFGVRHD